MEPWLISATVSAFLPLLCKRAVFWGSLRKSNTRGNGIECIQKSINSHGILRVMLLFK